MATNKVAAVTSVATLNNEAKKLALFSQKSSAAAQKVEDTTVEFTKNYPVKGDLTISLLETLSLDCIIAGQAVFERTFLHLILLDFLETKDVQSINAYIELIT